MNSSLEKCRLCNSSSYEEIPYPGKEGGYDGISFSTIKKCNSCGFGVALPSVDQKSLDDFYKTGSYWQGLHGGNRQQVTHEKAMAETRVNYCRKYLSGKSNTKILEIGSGHGYISFWLDRFKDFDVSSYDFIEPDPDKVRLTLSRKMRFKIHSIPDLSKVQEKYDFIFANHVIEHVIDPVGFVFIIKSFLNEDGIAYIETPHHDYEFKKDVFPHTCFFAGKSFERLAKSVSVKTLECEEFGRFFGLNGVTAHSFIVSKLFSLSIKSGIWFWQKALDNYMWKYNQKENGIWLRWVFTR
jgi:2-polyprenyl-3-methyl-5-hydroxy-6-metoxy-1,4-benzoquinol methylase